VGNLPLDERKHLGKVFADLSRLVAKVEQSPAAR
jgi:hypothetical protein